MEPAVEPTREPLYTPIEPTVDSNGAHLRLPCALLSCSRWVCCVLWNVANSLVDSLGGYLLEFAVGSANVYNGQY
eukprot:11184607-Lingulodinium_polyedra.AAC.1